MINAAPLASERVLRRAVEDRPRSSWQRVLALIALSAALLLGCGRSGGDFSNETMFGIGDWVNGEFRHVPLLSPDGRLVLVARMVGDGVEVSCLDTVSDEWTLLAAIPGDRDETMRSYAWSPDGHRVAFLRPNKEGDSDLVFWKPDGSSHRVTTVPGQSTFKGVWLSEALYITYINGVFIPVRFERDGRWVFDEKRPAFLGSVSASRTSLGDDSREKSAAIADEKDGVGLVNLDQGADALTAGRVDDGVNAVAGPKAEQPTGLKRGRMSPEEQVELVAANATTVIYSFSGSLWTYDFATRRGTRVAKLDHTHVRWLSYSATNKAALYCSPEEDNSQWHAIYKVDLGDPGILQRSERATQTGVNAMKGRWVMQGRGMAYLEQTKDESRLRIVPTLPGGPERSWFEGSYVRSFEVSPDGDELSALASDRGEPLGVWKLDIATGSKTRLVAPGGTNTILPLVRAIRRPDGKLRQVAIFAPPELAPGHKYPALIEVPVQGGWKNLTQVLPRAGVFHLVLGLDATMAAEHYGGSAEEAVAAWDMLVKDFPVDPTRIFIQASSGASKKMCEVVEAEPGRWRGIIMNGPVALPALSRLDPERVALYMDMGTEDPALKATQEFVKEGRAAGFQMDLVLHPGDAHYLRLEESRRRRMTEIVRFLTSTAALPTKRTPDGAAATR